MRRLFWIAFVIALFVSVPVAFAQSPRLSADAGELTITGEYTSQSAAFCRSLRLTATGGDVTDLRVLSSDLIQTGDNAILIDRSNISIPAGVMLKDKQPQDVRVTVSNVPGSRRSSLHLDEKCVARRICGQPRLAIESKRGNTR